MKSRFEGAVVTVQDKPVAVVAVRPAIFQNSVNATMIIKSLLPVFKGMPVVLMAIDQKGVPGYFGRSDLIELLSSINIKEADWRPYETEINLDNSSCPSKED